MRILQTCFSVLIFAVLVGGSFFPAATVHAQSITHGTVVALQGTPHLWIGDEDGVLHWGGDTRALVGKYINWGDRVEVSLDQLNALERGDPWLSAGLLKDGDPIYLVKWETNWAEPQLLQIQSWSDVELFGITADNYGDFVLERSAWEAAYGFSVSDLQISTLAGTSPSSTPPGTTPISQNSQEAVVSRSPGVTNNDDDDDDDADDDTTTATDTATATGTGDLTATATATATDDGTSITFTETDDTPDSQNVPTATATDTATVTATATATAT